MGSGRLDVALAVRDKIAEYGGRNEDLGTLLFSLQNGLDRLEGMLESLEGLLYLLRCSADVSGEFLQDAVGRLQLGHAEVVGKESVLGLGGVVDECQLDVFHGLFVSRVGGCRLRVVEELGLAGPVKVGKGDVVENVDLVVEPALGGNGGGSLLGALEVALVQLQGLGVLLLRQVDVCQVEVGVGDGVSRDLPDAVENLLGLEELPLFGNDGSQPVGGVGIGVVLSEDALVVVPGVSQITRVPLRYVEVGKVNVSQAQERVGFHVCDLLSEQPVKDLLGRLPIAEGEMEVPDEGQDLRIARCGFGRDFEPPRALVECPAVNGDAGQSEVAIDVGRVSFENGLVELDRGEVASRRLVKACKVEGDADREGVFHAAVLALDQNRYGLGSLIGSFRWFVVVLVVLVGFRFRLALVGILEFQHEDTALFVNGNNPGGKVLSQLDVIPDLDR
mmetsp:Transcript_27758/g.65212  ORF Transcript_27758/g.65212 Transcript_27758/m.65212 type:complete len:447 (+) Transcript_27758:871-2211(+)